MHGDGDHAPKHHKLALGKIDDARGVVDDVKAYGHNGIDDAICYAGKKILYEEFRSLAKRINNRKRGGEMIKLSAPAAKLLIYTLYYLL
jgi:hypothetical protein